MSDENPQGQEQAPATTELPNGAAAAPADGVAAPAEPQQTQEPQAQAQDDEATPEHRKAKYRFSEMSRELRKAREEAAYFRGLAEAQRLGQPQATPQPQPQAPVQDADPEPSPASYAGKEFDPAYLRELAKWEGRQAVKAELARAQQEREASERMSAEQRAFEEGKARFIEAHNEAAEVEEQYPELAGAVTATLENIARAEPPGTPGRLVDVITRADNKAWVAAALARDPHLLQSIRALDPVSRALAIGKIDARISANLAASQSAPRPAQAAPAAPAASAAVAPSNSPAPTPPPQLNGRGAAPSIDPSTASIADYIAARQSGALQ